MEDNGVDNAATGEIEEIVLSVKSRGAAGDGTTDDTSAIRSTINEVLSKGGGTAFVPAGTYKVTRTITVPKTVKLVGVGYGTKIMQYTNAIPIIKMAGSSDAYRCAVCDLWIGFNTPQTDSNGNGIQMADKGIMCYESEVSNVFIDNAYNGIVVKDLAGGYAWMNVFKLVKVNRSYHYAFNLYNPDSGACTTTTMINCYAMQDSGAVKATAGGFFIRNMTDCTLIDCAVDDLKHGRALFVMSSNATVIGFHVENCNMISTASGNSALITISGSIASIIGMRLENMIINKPLDECYGFDVNSDSLVSIVGLSEYKTTKIAGTYFSVVPDGVSTAVYITNWKGMFGPIGEWAPPYKVKVCNGDIRTTKVNGKTRAFANAMPSSGSWTKDDYIENTSRSVQGTSPNKYIVKGWIRMTTGKNNVLGKDWFEDRSFTGT